MMEDMEPNDGWLVFRMDDNGNQSILAQGLSEHEATTLARVMQDRGHKQTYVAVPTKDYLSWGKGE